VQRGTISQRGRHWILRYWAYELRNGIKTRVNVHKKLAPIGPAYPDKKSVEPLAWKYLEPVNTRLQTPESATPICEFIETVYLPMVEKFLRPSTFKDYKHDCYLKHFQHRLGNWRLRDFRTAHGQRLISAIAKDNPHIGHKTLLRLKSFMSGVFRHAKTEGYLDGENPMRDVTLPKTVRRAKFRGETLTIRDIMRQLACVSSSEVAFAAIATAAFTGLRLAELRGLQWKDYDGQRLRVERTVWRTKQQLPKTESSENTVPVLPVLRMLLDNYRHHLEGLPEEGDLGKTLKPHDWMFAGEKRGTSLNLPNLVRRTIIPLLTRCKHCGVEKHLHAQAMTNLAKAEPNAEESSAQDNGLQDISVQQINVEPHPFELNETIPQWKGWHCYRRSLASNLYSLGIKPKIIQAILRHGDIGTTLSYYVEVPEAETRAAMDALMGLIGAVASPK